MSELVLIGNSNQLAKLIQQSFEKPLFLYKHSTNCGSSRNAHVAIHHFIKKFPGLASQFSFAVVRVIEEKNISDQITNDLGVPHMSPLLLLVYQGKVIWNASHQMIHSNNLSASAQHFLKNIHHRSEKSES
ncbi:MAG: bacillithiol system protein [Paenibacillus sp. RIFOXYA1_FULL_44_5]|nr:MAG: bacillithiol system protein [Paenibacillus sp. RIFOXYA1_FULL_44_5]